MRKSELKNCPTWLAEADTVNENVKFKNGRLIWLDGEFRGGVFSGGVWRGGEFTDGRFAGGKFRSGRFTGGVFRSGVFTGGEFSGGEFRGGEFSSGRFTGGEFRSGVFTGGRFTGGVFTGGEFSGGVFSGGEFRGDWRGGTWHGGTWKRTENRIKFMTSLVGIVFDSSGHAVAYRTTMADGRGRYTKNFVQPEGEYYEDDLPPAGSGTCGRGIHVTSAGHAWTYFGIIEDCQFWRVTFARKDLLDCDGKKARIRGGVFEKIDRPF